MRQVEAVQFKIYQSIFMLKYEFKDNLEGGKTLTIIGDNLIIMNLHSEAENHGALIEFLEDENNLKKYVEYLYSNPNRVFDINEILKL